MAKAPSFPLYPSDIIRDTRILSLTSKGAWCDFLFFAHSSEKRGELTYSVSGWARLWGCDEDTANECIKEILNSKIGDVTICNGNVTLINRRMKREEKVKDQTRLRVQRHRETQPCNAPVTPLYTVPSSSSSSLKKKEDIYIVEIINYLNQLSGKNYKLDSKNTIKYINARIKEGFTVDQCKQVIDIKVGQWKNDQKLSKYLRPETLFGNKFESYLNEKPSTPKEGGFGKVLF